MTIPGKVQSYMAVGKPIIGAINGSCHSSAIMQSAKQYKLYWYSKNILFLQRLYGIKITAVSPVTGGVYFEYI